MKPGRADPLRREIVLAKEQKKSVGSQLARTQELIALHEELAVARINTREKAMHLSEVQQAATARHRISEASLALKMARRRWKRRSTPRSSTSSPNR